MSAHLAGLARPGHREGRFVVAEIEGIDIAANAAHIANYLRRSYPMVEREDILQTIFVWVYSHEAKVEEYQDGTEHGRNKLLKSMRGAGIKFCQEEKARILGYRPEDNYYYDLPLIRDILTKIWDEEAWTSPPQPDEQARVKRRAPNEGNEYVTTLADVSRVVALLSLEDQRLLRDHYHLGITSSELAESRGVTGGAVDGRLGRLTRKVQRLLGGERPQV
jgi:DNA-directed RNA polymerase specialized sigma24 family protein